MHTEVSIALQTINSLDLRIFNFRNFGLTEKAFELEAIRASLVLRIPASAKGGQASNWL